MMSKSIAMAIVVLAAVGLAGCVAAPQPSSAPTSAQDSSSASPTTSASAPPSSGDPTPTPSSSPEPAAEAIADGQESCTILAGLAEDLAALQDQLSSDGSGGSVDADALQRIQDGIAQSGTVAGPLVQPYVEAESQAFASLRAGIEQGDPDAIQASGFTDATVAMTFYCLNNLDPDPS